MVVIGLYTAVFLFGKTQNIFENNTKYTYKIVQSTCSFLLKSFKKNSSVAQLCNDFF
ncbi:hypothetical protein FLBR109950_07085 [Flavobacterium branchiophilum]